MAQFNSRRRRRHLPATFLLAHRMFLCFLRILAGQTSRSNSRSKQLCDRPKAVPVKKHIRRCFFIYFLAPLAQEEELKQVIVKHDKYDLVDHHRKGARVEISDITKAFELAVFLLCSLSKMVLLMCPGRILDILSVNQ